MRAVFAEGAGGPEVLVVHGPDGAPIREIPTDGTVAGLRAALDGVDSDSAASVSLRSPSLDDVFLQLTGKA